MTLRRGIVQGYDTTLSAPKGVAGAIDVRQSVAAVAQRTGVYWDRDDPCTATGTATMNVDITGFRAAIESPLGGFYVVTADDTESVAIAASDSTNARYDIIYVDQEDYQVDGSQVDSEAVLPVATGTPALTPTDPSIPSTALALYRVEVPAGVTTTNAVGVVITPLFDYTAPVGSPLPLRNSTEQSALAPYDELLIHRLDQHTTSRYRSAAWHLETTSRARHISSRAATQSLASGTTPSTLIDLDTTLHLGIGFTRSGGTLTCALAGTYKVHGQVTFAGNTTGIRYVRLNVDGGARVVSAVTAVNGSGAQTLSVDIFDVVALTVGQTVTLTAAQNSGGALNVTGILDVEFVA